VRLHPGAGEVDLLWAVPRVIDDPQGRDAPPVAAGVKVTLMVQEPVGATGVLHVFVWAKSPGLVPTIVIAPTTNG